MTFNVKSSLGERGGLMVSASDSGARGRRFDTYLRCVVSLSKKHSLPKSTGNTQEPVAPYDHDWNIVYRDVKNQINQPASSLNTPWLPKSIFCLRLRT